MRAAHRFHRVVGLGDGRASLLSDGVRAGHDVLGRLVSFGHRVGHVVSEHDGGQHQVVEHVVAVPHPADAEFLIGVEGFHYRHQIGRRLAGVVLVGQRVDHRYVGALRKFRDVGVRIAAVGDGAKEAGQHLGRVRDGLAGAQLDVVLQEGQRVSTKAIDADLKGNTGAGARLLVDASHGKGVQRHEIEDDLVAALPEPLEFDGPAKHRFKVVSEVVNREQGVGHACVGPHAALERCFNCARARCLGQSRHGRRSCRRTWLARR